MLSELYVSYRTHSLKLCPSNITLSLRVGWKWLLALMPYGEAWKEGRRMFTQYFHPGNTEVYKATQMEFLYKMLPRLLNDPENFLSITRQYVSQLVINLNLKEYSVSAVGWIAISLAYGLDIRETDDPHIKRAEKATKSVEYVTGSGTYLVDILPILRYVPSWVPGATFQKDAKIHRQFQDELRQVPYEETIRNIVCLIYKISSR